MRGAFIKFFVSFSVMTVDSSSLMVSTLALPSITLGRRLVSVRAAGYGFGLFVFFYLTVRLIYPDKIPAFPRITRKNHICMVKNLLRLDSAEISETTKHMIMNGGSRRKHSIPLI